MLQTLSKTISPLITEHLPEIRQLAKQNQVARLELFGSAVHNGLTEASDLDFLVVFLPLAVQVHGENYFALKHGLEDLLGKPVDLLELETIENPYFLKSIESERTLLYAA